MWSRLDVDETLNVLPGDAVVRVVVGGALMGLWPLLEYEETLQNVNK